MGRNTRPRRNCERCGSLYTPKGNAAKYCSSCKKASFGVINSTRLLNYALSELGITKTELTERFRLKNLGEDM